MKAEGRTAFGTKFWEFPKGSSIKIREIINRARGEDFGLSYQVIIPTRIRGRQRVRKQFAELDLAKEFAKSQFKGKEEFASQFFELDEKKMREVQLAMAELPPGHSLLDAVREYTKQLKKDKRNPIAVDEAVSTYVKTLKKLNKRERTIEDVRYRLNLFGSTFGKWKIDTIRQEDIEEWLESHSRLSPRSLKNFRDSVKTFLNWAKEQKYISDNPATKVKVPVIDWKPPVIVTVEESKKLFQTAAQLALECLIEKLENDEIPAEILPVATGILIDKHRQAEGEPSQTIEVKKSLSLEDVRSELAEIRKGAEIGER